MKLRCECGVEVLAKNVNLAAAVASCEACGAVFSIDQSKPAVEAPKVIPLAFGVRESLGEEALPSAYRQANQGAGARWTYRWFRWSYVFMVFFFLFWDAICSVFVVAGFSQGVMGLFSLLIPHVWVGVLGSYWVLAHLFNRSTITLTSQGLSVQSGPIPWPSKSIAREQISTLDVHKGWRNNNQQQFQVRVIDKDKRPKRLLSALTEEEARYLCDELNLELEKQG
jgi:hypothetical protein